MTPLLTRLLSLRANHIRDRLILKQIEQALTAHIDQHNRNTVLISAMARDASNRTLGVSR